MERRPVQRINIDVLEKALDYARQQKNVAEETAGISRIAQINNAELCKDNSVCESPKLQDWDMLDYN